MVKPILALILLIFYIKKRCLLFMPAAYMHMLSKSSLIWIHIVCNIGHQTSLVGGMHHDRGKDQEKGLTHGNIQTIY